MNDFIPDDGSLVDRVESGFSVTEKFDQVVDHNETKFKATEDYQDPVRNILTSYDIGQKLRQLRLRKKIALVDLGKHTGLSASMLSQLENGKLIPTLPTLVRIALVFDVGLDFFFGEKRAKRVFSIVRADERFRFPELSDNPVPGYYFEVLTYGAVDKNISAYLAEFPQLEATDVSRHSHEGSEFIHVLHGALAINYQSEEHILETGDSVYFDSSEAHSYHGKSDPPAKAIVITVPLRM